MIALRAADVADLVGGRLVAADGDAVITGPVVIDSRLAAPGSLFVCLAGEHTDGHRHAPDAARAGAVLALAQRPVEAPAVLVDDVQQALGRLAAGVLARSPGVRVSGVTGSSGKTSTKDLMAAVLGAGGPAVAAAGSFNNEIGLPLTVLGVDGATAHLVLEYSARRKGHIAYLTGIARPDTAVVLNVGSAHLGEFGSREAIAAAKGELVEALPPTGVAVLNVDDPMVAAMSGRTAARVLRVGTGPGADLRVADLTLDETARPRFRLLGGDADVEVRLRLHGRHHAGNAAAAAAAGIAAGIPLDVAAEALGRFTAASPHRMAVTTRTDGLLVIDDAYNANPESMRAALAALVEIAERRGGRGWAVLGEMRELGDDTPSLHAAVGDSAAALGVDHLVVVGDAAVAIGDGARAHAGWSGEVTLVPSAAEAVDLVAAGATARDVVLVKASNAVGLWSVAESLLEPAAPAVGVTPEAGA
jgi:UDP-N-acetylmuramoyl-tripeptide--D-alanyl-D-alanine ligase